jgi:molecular chaperone GrpE
MSENNGEIGEEKLKTVVEEDTENQTEVSNKSKYENIEELRSQLGQEKEKSESYEKKMKYLLADFENLKKRTQLDIQSRVNAITDDIILKFLLIYDDFIRARDALSKQKADTTGLDGILKNMDSFLAELEVKPIEALGELFDPRFHEAISVKGDPELDDNTITAELRKGYILKDRVIRPSLVEISKRDNTRETK